MKMNPVHRLLMVYAVMCHLSASSQPEAPYVTYYRGEVDAYGQHRGPKVQISSGQPMSRSGSFFFTIEEGDRIRLSGVNEYSEYTYYLTGVLLECLLPDGTVKQVSTADFRTPAEMVGKPGRKRNLMRKRMEWIFQSKQIRVSITHHLHSNWTTRFELAWTEEQRVKLRDWLGYPLK